MVQAFIIGGLDLEDLDNWRDPAWMWNCRLRRAQAMMDLAQHGTQIMNMKNAVFNHQI